MQGGFTSIHNEAERWLLNVLRVRFRTLSQCGTGQTISAMRLVTVEAHGMALAFNMYLLTCGSLVTDVNTASLHKTSRFHLDQQNFGSSTTVVRVS